MAFLRKDANGDALVIVCNFSPVDRTGYTVGVPVPGVYTVVFNSDDPDFGGKGGGDHEPVRSRYVESQGREQSITISLPPMSAVIYKCTRKFPVRKKKADKEASAKPAVRKKAAAPAVKAEAAKPAVRKKAAAPAVKEAAPKPAVRKKAAAPAVKAEAAKPAVRKKKEK